MNHAKRLLAAFSSCLIVTSCAVAFAAAPAQAEGKWLINGSTLEASVNWEGDSSFYAFLLPNLNLELVFEKFEFKSGTLTAEGKGTAEFIFANGKVNTISPLEEVSSCIPGNLTFNSTTNLFLHNGKTYNALSVNTITTYKTGLGCPLAAKNVVSGTVVLEDPEGNFEKEATKHLIQVLPNGLFPELKMFFGANPLTLDGSWVLSLTGSHAGKTWSGIG
jgi:hypothetical protein